MALELADAESAGGHREAAGADGFGAGDVFGGIADDPCFLGVERFARMHFGALQCNRAEPVAVGVVTTIGAKGEKIGQSEMSHLDTRALRRVASEQAECGALTCSQMLKQWKNTIDHAS